VNVEVKVIAGAKKREIRLEGTRLKVKLTSKPVHGRANEELIELFAETFPVKKREVRIIAGEKDTRKIISVPIDEDRFWQIIQQSATGRKEPI
jgi:uncharacterized protein